MDRGNELANFCILAIHTFLTFSLRILSICSNHWRLEALLVD